MRVYDTEKHDVYYIRDRFNWYRLSCCDSLHEKEIIVMKSPKPEKATLFKRRGEPKPSREFIEMVKGNRLKIYATRLGMRPNESFNANSEGYEICRSRITTNDGIVRKQYRLLDGFQFLAFDIYATDGVITYAEIDYRDSETYDTEGLNLTLPEPVAMSIEEEKVLDELIVLSRELMAKNVVIAKNAIGN